MKITFSRNHRYLLDILIRKSPIYFHNNSSSNSVSCSLIMKSFYYFLLGIYFNLKIHIFQSE